MSSQLLGWLAFIVLLAFLAVVMYTICLKGDFRASCETCIGNFFLEAKDKPRRTHKKKGDFQA